MPERLPHIMEPDDPRPVLLTAAERKFLADRVRRFAMTAEAKARKKQYPEWSPEARTVNRYLSDLQTLRFKLRGIA